MRSLVWKLVLAALTLALVAAPLAGTPTAWAASPALEEAQALYDGAQFNDAIAKIRAGLSSGQLTGSDAIAARALMARCLVKSGNRLEAKQAFKFVLRQQAGWRPDASVGPDEREVFELAQRELTAEQIEAGKRIPASLSFSYGRGSGDNEDMAEIVVAGGGPDKYDPKPQLGGSVRFPVAQKWSLDLELQRLRATNRDANQPPNDTRFEITAYPISLSLIYTAYTQRWVRANLFAGGGVLSSAISKIEFGDFGGSALTVSGQKNGGYFHGGLEAEILVHPRVALTGRVLGRSAKAEKVLDEFDFDAYGQATLKNRTIDFSGIAATFGLRAYIGY
jgi:hypothetical protein